MLIKIGSFVNLEAHVFIKSLSLRVLLVNGQLFNAIVDNSGLEQAFSQSFSSLFWREEKHFQHTVLDSHEGCGTSIFIFRDY